MAYYTSKRKSGGRILTPQDFDVEDLSDHHHQEQLHQRQQEEKRMSEFEQKDNTLTLWMNDKKTKPTDPLMTGKGLIDGKEKRVAAWKNTSKAGKSYMTLKVNDPLDTRTSAPAPAPVDVDDIPF